MIGIRCPSTNPGVKLEVFCNGAEVPLAPVQALSGSHEPETIVSASPCC